MNMRGLPSAWRPKELVLSIPWECLRQGNGISLESCSISIQQRHPNPRVNCAQNISGCIASTCTI